MLRYPRQLQRPVIERRIALLLEMTLAPAPQLTRRDQHCAHPFSSTVSDDGLISTSVHSILGKVQYCMRVRDIAPGAAARPKIPSDRIREVDKTTRAG